MTKNVLIVCSGLPASGKSTFAELLEEGNFYRVCPDLIRKELYGDESIQGDGNLVFSIAHDRVRAFGDEGYNVVFDATNIDRKTRKNLVEQMRPYFDILICYWFSTPLYICKIRNQERKRQVPYEVLESMERRFVAPTMDEGWDYVAEIKNY